VLIWHRQKRGLSLPVLIRKSTIDTVVHALGIVKPPERAALDDDRLASSILFLGCKMQFSAKGKTR
jgi:hypothetical protein